MDKIVFGLTALVLAGVAVTAVVLIARHETRCDRFEPRWNTLRTERAAERNRFARLVVKCGSLDGLSRAGVRERLGPGDGAHASRWAYDAGAPEGLDLIAGQLIEVTFSPDGRVKRARLVAAPPPSDS